MCPPKSAPPIRSQPLMTWGLIALNVVVFLLQAGMTEGELAAFLDRFALIPERYFQSGSVGSFVRARHRLFTLESNPGNAIQRQPEMMIALLSTFDSSI